MMIRQLQSYVAGGALALAIGALFSAGCAENDSSLFIQGVLAPEPPECSVTASPGETFLGSGILDVAFSTEYSAWLLVGNQLTPRGAKNQLRAETARVRLQGAIVVVEDDQGNELAEFSVPGTGFVTVNRGEEAAFGAFLTTLVPAGTGSGLRSSVAVGSGSRVIIAKVRVFGETLGGREIESADYTFPITVCNGCTVAFPLDALNYSSGEAMCSNTGTEPATLPPCFPGQGAIDCRSCAGTYEICRAAGQGNN